MTNYLFAQPNLSTGVDDALISLTNTVPAFPVMILVFVFFLVLISGTNNQKKRTGVADYPFWTVLASLSMFMLALIFTLNGTLINITVLGIVIAITILSAAWYFLSSTRGEPD